MRRSIPLSIALLSAEFWTKINVLTIYFWKRKILLQSGNFFDQIVRFLSKPYTRRFETKPEFLRPKRKSRQVCESLKSFFWKNYLRYCHEIWYTSTSWCHLQWTRELFFIFFFDKGNFWTFFFNFLNFNFLNKNQNQIKLKNQKKLSGRL